MHSNKLLKIVLLTSASLFLLIIIFIFNKPASQKNKVASEQLNTITASPSRDSDESVLPENQSTIVPTISTEIPTTVQSIEMSTVVSTSDLATSAPTNEMSTVVSTSDLATSAPNHELSAVVPTNDLATSTPTTEVIEYNSEANDNYNDYFYYKELSDDIIARIYGLSYKTDCPVPYSSLRYVSILYFDFNGNVQNGELICNVSVAQDFVEIFRGLYDAHYPLERVRLVDEYQADDKLSMIANNTSCFNYRTVEGTKNISKHGLGLAIDVNPFYNPYVTKNSDGSLYISPPGSELYADRSLYFPYKIDENDLCYKLFTSHGFKWGGHYRTLKDYQHFYKEQ